MLRAMARGSASDGSAPAAAGPYRPAVRAGEFLFVSGQLPLAPGTGEVVSDSVEAATERAILNLRAVLEANSSSLAKVVKTTVYLADMSGFSAMNEVYARYFDESKPSRACVECSRLPRGVLVEIEAVAS
jgi:2-iminobutanoate/2-iminopropanoate deaminase